MLETTGADDQKFPQTHVQVSPQGVKVIFILAPGYEHSYILPEETMNQIEQLRQQSRQETRNSLALIKHINSSKVN